jgi:hypothetical protein
MTLFRLSAFYRLLRKDRFYSGLILSAFFVTALISHRAHADIFEPVANVSLTQASFLSPDYNLTQKKDFQFIGAGFDTLSKPRADHELEDGLQAQINGMVAPGNSVLSYLNVSQLFWKQSFLSIGRKMENWSYLDSNYTLGIYQPLFQWDPLLPREQGLTGIYLTLDSPDTAVPWGFVVFGSPMYIPDQGAGYDIKNGQFERSNPYFQAPPGFFQIQGQTDVADYNVQKPDTNSVIFNRSFAGKAYIGKESEGPYAQVAFANKPVNQLALGFEGFVTPNNSVDVEIQPQVYYHSLASADVLYSWKNAVVGVSALKENITEPDFDPQWTYVDYSASNLLSPFAKYRERNFNVTVSYLSVQGGTETIKGDLSDQSSSYLPHRYPFRSAYQAVVNYRVRIFGPKYLYLSTRYLQGSQNEFALWTTQLSYQLQSRWSLHLTSQLVDVKDTPAGDMIAYQPYNNNDAVGVGVSYVF